MRLLRHFALLLALLSPLAGAETARFQIETILFRQGTPILAGQTAPDDWANGAQIKASDSSSAKYLNDEASKLTPANGYQVLLHQAWQQTLSGTPVKVVLSEGAEQFGHFPVQGTLRLKFDRLIDMQADLWVNRLEDGHPLESEHLQQKRRLKPGELTFIDSTSLGLLIRVTPLQ
jgi:hypothetical protein